MRRPRTLRIAHDDRGRVPFALVGVLLLVSSVAYAGASQNQGRIAVDEDVEQVVERTAADTTPAIRAGVENAARDAAAEPVTTAPKSGSADATVTSAVRDGSAFEDALRIRIAVAVEEALRTTERRDGDLRAASAVPSVENASDLVAARERVVVESAANGTALRATVRNVTTTVRQEDRVVAERSRNVSVVVPVPVLAAHERTERFERRLNRGALDGPGLGRQLTARLYPVTWARGYAQHYGAPVQNVLGNRHVELSTNTGIARVQRDVYGGVDPRAERGVRRATAETALEDLLAPTDLDEDEWSQTVVGQPAADDPVTGEDPESGLRDPPDRPETSRTVSVGGAADEALVSTLDDRDAIARRAYRTEATLVAEPSLRADRTVTDGPTPDDPPGENWTLVETERDRSVTVETPRTDDRAGGAAAGRPDGADEGHAFGSSDRAVTVIDETTRTWTNGTATATGRETRTRGYLVSIDVRGAYAPAAGAPDAPTAPVFERGGALDGPNLADVPATARAELDAETSSDLSAVARRAALDGTVESRETVAGERPSRLAPFVESDLASLHREVRGLSANVSMTAVAANEADPYGALAERVRERRTDLVSAPETYDGAADRARVAVRAAYVEAVVAELENRSAADDGVSEAVGEAGDDGAGIDASRFGEYLDVRADATAAPDRSIGDDGPGGGVDLVPRGSPGYLPRTAVDGDAVSGVTADGRVRPLATRNTNVVTMPYGDVATGIVDRLVGGEETVPLSAAGRVLSGTDRAVAETDDAAIRAERDRLAATVEPATGRVESTAARVLRRESNLTAAERRTVIRAARERWGSTGDLAVAMGDGAYANAVASEASRRGDLTAADREVLAADLRTAIETETTEGGGAVSAATTNRSASVLRTVARDRVESGVESGVEYGTERAADRWGPEALQTVPAGAPVLPTPTHWYATVNVWTVAVRGEYARFAVTAPGTGPPGEEFEYVRRNASVSVDLGEETVTLGKTDAVRFETGTVVVVAVPPGPPGVGDVDGTRTETSPGWPCPEPGAETGRDSGGGTDGDCGW